MYPAPTLTVTGLPNVVTHMTLYINNLASAFAEYEIKNKI